MSDEPAYVQQFDQLISNANYRELQDFYRLTDHEGWDFIQKKTTATLRCRYVRLEKNGCYELGYGAIVCTQYKLKSIIKLLRPSLVVLCEQYYGGPGSRFDNILEWFHELKDEFHKHGVAFMRIDTKTEHRFFSGNDANDTSRCYQSVRQAYAHGGIVLFVEWVPHKLFRSKLGQYPLEVRPGEEECAWVGEGPEAVPQGAFAAAITTAAVIFNIDTYSYLRYLQKRSPVAHHLALDGVKKLHGSWDVVTQAYLREERFQDQTWKTEEELNPNLYFERDEQLEFRASIIKRQMQHIGIVVHPEF